MSLEPLPPHLEQQVNRFAKERHLSKDEALRDLLTTALRLVDNPAEVPKLGIGPRSVPIEPNLDVAEGKSIVGMMSPDPKFDSTMDTIVAERASRYSAGK